MSFREGLTLWFIFTVLVIGMICLACLAMFLRAGASAVARAWSSRSRTRDTL